MSAGSTPGPYTTSPFARTNDGAIIILAPDGDDGKKPIAHVLPVAEGRRKRGADRWRDADQERDANAALFMAAPDMLAALREILDGRAPPHDGGYQDHVEALRDIARAAIAKAEGK